MTGLRQIDEDCLGDIRVAESRDQDAGIGERNAAAAAAGLRG